MKKLFLIFVLVVFYHNHSFANQNHEVEKFIDNLGNQIIKIAGDEKLDIEQKRTQLINLVDEVVDTNWISKFVLGKHYRRANKEQKDKFKTLYREFMINTYSPKFTGYNGEKFSITNINNDGNYYTAKCLFFPKNEAPTINLDFRVRKNKKSDEPQFLVFDIVAEGVSLIETQRSEFGSVISKDGLDKFLANLQERVVNLKNGQDDDNISLNLANKKD